MHSMNRQVREQELFRWSTSEAGKNRIFSLWKKIKGIPEGVQTLDTIGTLVRQEMIPEILNHEYPND